MSILKKYIDKLQSQKYLQKDRNSITVDDVTIDFPLVSDGNEIFTPPIPQNSRV